MLTKADSSVIRKIIREEVGVEFRSLGKDLTGEIKLFRMRIENRLSDIENAIKDLDIRIANSTVEIKSLSRSLKRARKDIKIMIDLFDTQDVKLHKRVEKIEKHLNLLN